MNKVFYALVVLIAVIIAGIILIVLPGKTSAPTEPNGQTATTTPTGTATTTQPYADMITPGTPVVTATTLTINGKARGGWYFEASFPVELKNADGVTIALAPAQAQSDWMTSNFVPFSATLTYAAQPAGSKGTLILRNDNPSGLPENDKSVTIPVVF